MEIKYIILTDKSIFFFLKIYYSKYTLKRKLYFQKKENAFIVQNNIFYFHNNDIYNSMELK